MMAVEKIESKLAYPFLLDIHYAKRIPSISYAYGLYDTEGLLGSKELIGVCTYGTPASAPLKRGICGDEFKGEVIELNRLCLLDNGKNQASFLVGKSLSMLPRPKIIISYADISQGHTGYVYQATNFLYCGLSAKRTDWKVKGKEHLHGQTIADEFRGVKNRLRAMRDKYGDDFYLAPRPRKHRYVFFIGSKTQKKHYMKALKYKTESYPK